LGEFAFTLKRLTPGPIITRQNYVVACRTLQTRPDFYTTQPLCLWTFGR